MMGWAKVAKKHWPHCRVVETESAMDILDSDGSLLVAARRDGVGSFNCAQKVTHAKYPLSVLQHGNALKEHEGGKEEKKPAKEKSAS